jgi:enamine deaminase RidA (YjgF/YER057c/UK114 family)
MRQKVSAKTIWEDTVGYSRAVRIGEMVFVGGTAATDSQGVTHGQSDPYAQTAYALNKIEEALRELGASLEDVVRTRIFVKNIEDWREIARAHAESFGHVRPCTTMVEVSRLITSDLLVEIEADAVLDEPNDAAG